MRLIVFDMDGTLIDTHGLIAEHMSGAFRAAELPVPTPADVRGIIGLTLPVAIARLADTADTVLVDRLVDDYKHRYRVSLELAGDREPLFPGARAALDRLRAQPGTVLGIATGKGLSGATRILALHELTGYFATVQTPDHNPGKPHPGMLYRAMAETGATPAETVMVGDTVFDIELAVNAGVASVGVAWGYHEPRELTAAGATTLIDSYDQLDAAIAAILE
jgi:phosphoglycolate phosphatase